MGPGIRFPVLQLQQWMQVWIHSPQLRAGINQAWPVVLNQLRGISPERRTKHIRGPLSALVHQLLVLGWDPEQADRWHGPCSDGDGIPDFSWNFHSEQLVGMDQTRGLVEDFRS
eukprot:2000777-Pyramimonas_sp.AAC.1